MKLLTTTLLLLCFTTQAADFEVSTEHGSVEELATVDLLEALRKSHDLSKWEFTKNIHIDEKSIPHSHPTLTLHTRHTTRSQTDLLLSTYVHEQIHWYLEGHDEQTNSAIIELKALFKNVPVGYPEGARDEHSTYLHLLVCYLELDAMSQLLSQSRHQRITESWQGDHYTWIYAQVVLRSEDIARIVREHGLKI